MSSPRSLPAELRQQWSRRPGDDRRIVPFEGSSHGDHVVVEVQGKAGNGVAMEDLATHQIHWIQRFSSASAQAFGTWDGTHAVWVQYLNTEFNRFTVWSWSPGHAPRMLGRDLPSVAQAGYTAALDWPALSGSFAAWIRASGPDGQAQLLEADLATSQVHVAAQGYLADPVYYDGLLMWGQAPRPGTRNAAKAMDPKTGTPRRVPPAVAEEQGGYAFTTSGTAIAFLENGPSGAGGVVYYSSSPTRPARPVFTVRGTGSGLNWPIQLQSSLISATGFDQSGVSGDWIISGDRGSSYFVAHAGFVRGNARDVFFSPGSSPSGGQGTAYPPGNIAAIPHTEIPIPNRCG